jgi:hypothetical protein
MPTPSPGLVHASARSTVGLGTGVITGPLTSAWTQIQTDVDRLRARWPDESPPVRARRLAALEAKVARLMAAAQDQVRDALPTVVRDVFDAAGVSTSTWLGRGLRWSDDDLAVLDALTRDLWADLAQATAFTRSSATALARTLSKLARQIPELHVDAERSVRRELEQRGISAVVYRDGSRHGLDVYARMAARTKLAQAWQLAGLRVMARYGVEFVEVVDGAGCGWTSHLDGRKASGLILSLDEAMAYPIAHPNCVRTTFPRLDVASAEQAAGAAPQAGQVGDGDPDPVGQSVRDSSGLLDVRSRAVSSPALQRHIAMATKVGPGVAQPVARVSRVARVTPVGGPAGG